MPEEHSNPSGLAPDGSDPIIAAIAAYRAGMAAYDATPDESDECIARTYGPPLDVLKSWTEPARTFEGAREALRLASQELDADLVDASAPMVRAALAFFEEAA